MAFSLRPHEAHLLRIFLVLVSFLLAPASPAVVEPHVRVFAMEEPESPRRVPPLHLDFPSQHHKRDGSCPISGDHWCGNDLPGDFCCSSGSSCKVLAANTTALCCPKNAQGECEVIMPITCNIKMQNSSTYPEAAVKTLALDENLKQCGSKNGARRCCPFGYSCRDDKECVLDKDQDASYAFLLPISEHTSATTSATPTTSTAASSMTSDVLSVETSEAPDAIVRPPSATPTTSTAEPSTPKHDEEDEEDKEDGVVVAPTGAVIGGIVAGVCCVVGIGIFVWMKWFRKKKIQDTPNMPLTRESWGYFSARSTPATRHVHIARGPDDRFIVTPTTAGFTPDISPLAPIVEEKQSPVELPATPVSLCMWSNLENAAVEEPKLAYVVPAKQQ